MYKIRIPRWVVFVLIVAVMFVFGIVAINLRAQPPFQAPIQTLHEHGSGIHSAVWSPDGKKLATSALSGRIEIWDTDTWALDIALFGYPDDVYTVAWRPDGSQLASIGADNTLRIWDATSGTRLAIVDHKVDYQNELAWLSDDILIVFGNNVTVWDNAELQLLNTIEVGDNPSDLWGNRLAVGMDDTITVQDVYGIQEPQIIGQHTSELTEIAWRPDGRKLASATADEMVYIWDTETGAEEARFSHPPDELGRSRSVRDISWHPNGQQLATVGETTSYTDKAIFLWDSQTWEPSMTLFALPDTILRNSVLWSADGDYLSLIGEPCCSHEDFSGTILVWNSQSGEPLEAIKYQAPFGQMAWHPNSQMIVSYAGVNTFIWQIPHISD